MIRTLLYLFLLFSCNLNAQNCNAQEHSANVNDGWLSCEKELSPNAMRGEGHWVLYDLGYPYVIGTTHFWNYNVVGQTQEGMKDVTIDYSLDGTNWVELTNWSLDEASGDFNYQGAPGPDFKGVSCRYILISSKETWGGTCAGLSEVRFDIAKTVGLQNATSSGFEVDLFPNPAFDQLTLHSSNEWDEVAIINSSGFECYRGRYQSTLDVHFLPSGTYFLRLVGKKGMAVVERFVKQ